MKKNPSLKIEKRIRVWNAGAQLTNDISLKNGNYRMHSAKLCTSQNKRPTVFIVIYNIHIDDRT